MRVSTAPDGRPGRPPLDEPSVARGLAGIGLGRVLVLPRVASTSTELLQGVLADPHAWPDRSLVVTDHQVAGRGRAGRTWTTPAGAALTFSLLLRPPVALNRFGWVPLMAGLAVVGALSDVGPASGGHAGGAAVIKWPNDVLLPAPDDAEEPGWGRYRKVAGVLGDLVPTTTGPVVVVGIGINVSQDADELPVPSATSLALAQGGAPDRAELLGAVVRRLVDLDRRWRAASGDAWAAGIADECVAACATLGRQVRVEMPGGEVVEGMASTLGPDGALSVRERDGSVRSVLAGDVRHLRSGPEA
jgi:BirA family biotin operon repressor/biotin-[acetyl-CoA-carboxylase] ligase